MWIERLELLHFGSAANEAVEFGPRAINVVEESSEHDENVIPAVVLAILYGFDKNNSAIPRQLADISMYRPKEAADGPFMASMDCLQSGRRLKISRNFETNQITVIDRLNQDKDVTSEFLDGNDETIGKVLTRLTAEEFLSGCLLLAIDEGGGFKATGAIAAALSQIVNPVAPVYGKAAAVEVLETYLNHFPYKKIQIRIDFLVQELAQQKLELEKKAKSLEQERKEMVFLLSRVSALNLKLDADLGQVDANEYFQLCLQAAEIDGKVLHLRSQHVRLKNILKEIARIGSVDNLPPNCQIPIEELWKRRASRFDDYRRLEQELAPKIEEYEAYEREVTRRWEKLHSFTPEQAQSLKSNADNFLRLANELTELKRQRRFQASDANEANLDLRSYEETRQAVLLLEPNDINDAKSYSALIVGFRKQLAASEKGKSKAQATIKDIEEQRRSKSEAKAMIKMFKPTLVRQPELEAAQSDLARHVARIDDLRERIKNLEGRVAALAQRAGLLDGSKLLEYAHQHEVASPQLKELEKLDQLIVQRQADCDRLKGDFEAYFRQAGRGQQEINAQTIGALSHDVLACLQDFRSLNSTFSALKLSKQELESLAAEIRGIDEALQELFTRVSASNPADIEASYTEFYGKMAKHHHGQALQDEVAQAIEKYGFNPGTDEIHQVLAELENERTTTWSRITELVDLFPEIADASPPSAAELQSLGNQAIEPELQKVREERDGLQRKLNSFFNDYDQQYSSVLAMIESVGHQLATARNCKLALELAREVLEQLLMDDMTKVTTRGQEPKDARGESLPLIIDAACLAQDKLKFSLSLRFIISVIAPTRQIILLSNRGKLSLASFSPILKMSPLPIHFAWRKPLAADGVFQRAHSD